MFFVFGAEVGAMETKKENAARPETEAMSRFKPNLLYDPSRRGEDESAEGAAAVSGNR